MSEREPKCHIKYCRHAPATRFPVGHSEAIQVCQHHFEVLNYVNANINSVARNGAPEVLAAKEE